MGGRAGTAALDIGDIVKLIEAWEEALSPAT
jgi:hypothetical protein